MSTPSPTAPGAGASSAASTTRPQPAQGPGAQQAQGAQRPAPGKGAQPQPAPTTSTPGRPTSSTPRLLRVARGVTAAAALLTGVVATGTFDTGGVNSTPNVIAAQWTAAERTGVDLAEAELRTTEQAAARATGTELPAASETTATPVEALRAAAGAHARSGGEAGRSSETASQIAEAAVLVGQTQVATASGESATDGATGVAPAVSEDLTDARTLLRAATDSSDATATTHAEDLATGSRSVLTGVVGTLATLLMLGVLVWLALRTRRIVNVPLLVATVMTGWLAYVSLNPSAVPVSVDGQVGGTAEVASALQEVRQARAAQYAPVLGTPDTYGTDGTEATRALATLDDRELADTWQQVDAAQEDVAAAADPAAAAEVLAGTQEAWAGLEAELTERLDGRLAAATSRVGLPAVISSGLALLLGLAAAALAWAGITQRLKDYR
ncbi:hypothetical protein ACQE98_08560 [Ornithinimicrobium sp. W1679]|uniref:hypothetical protein n=1 Tax=Ornithinimicrobium sp. W1679 TaxID=3418770 RepID=UPI003CEBD394